MLTTRTFGYAGRPGPPAAVPAKNITGRHALETETNLRLSGTGPGAGGKVLAARPLLREDGRVTDAGSLMRVHDAFDRIEEQFSEALDESLDPAGPDVLYEYVA
jgi:hypothetical protein